MYALSPCEAMARMIYDMSFFHTFYSLWFFSPVLAFLPFIFLPKLKKNNSKDLAYLFLTAILILVFWGIVMFIPSSTSIHQGSFLPWVLLFAVSVVMFCRVSPYLFLVITILNAIVFFVAFSVKHGGNYCANVPIVIVALSGFIFASASLNKSFSNTGVCSFSVRRFLRRKYQQLRKD